MSVINSLLNWVSNLIIGYRLWQSMFSIPFILASLRWMFALEKLQEKVIQYYSEAFYSTTYWAFPTLCALNLRNLWSFISVQHMLQSHICHRGQYLARLKLQTLFNFCLLHLKVTHLFNYIHLHLLLHCQESLGWRNCFSLAELQLCKLSFFYSPCREKKQNFSVSRRVQIPQGVPGLPVLHCSKQKKTLGCRHFKT